MSKSGLPWGLSGKESACNAGDMGSIPGSGRSPGEGSGNPLQYSCLGNPMDRGAWWAPVHGVDCKELVTKPNCASSSNHLYWCPIAEPHVALSTCLCSQGPGGEAVQGTWEASGWSFLIILHDVLCIHLAWCAADYGIASRTWLGNWTATTICIYNSAIKRRKSCHLW